MGSFLISNPQVIYKQTSAPAVVAGGLWYDTDDFELYFSNGAAWTKITDASSAGNESFISKLSLEVLRLAVDATLTTPDYNFMFCDYFTDADGADNTINSGGSSSRFDTSLYTNDTPETSAHGETPWNDDGAYNTKMGMKVDFDEIETVTGITKDAGSQATNGYLQTSKTSGIVASGSFVGNTCIFDAPYTVAASTNYYVCVDKAGASWNFRKVAGTSFPIANNGVNWTACFAASLEETNASKGVASIIMGGTISDSFIRTTAEALDNAPTFIFLYAENSITGTSSINYDVSFNGGTSWDSTGNSLNTKIPVTDGSGKSMVIKINQNKGADDDIATVSNYAALLWN